MTRGASAYGVRCATLPRRDTSSTASCSKTVSRNCRKNGAQDALSLRQVEREEIMKHVLRWLFGPGFTFVPPGLPQNLYGPDQDVIDNATWGKVLSQGEVIKFLHQAIEWENMVFFLYPTFGPTRRAGS